MTDSPDEHGPKIASLETWRDQMNDQFRALNSSFSSGLNEIKAMIRTNEEVHRREIASVKSSIEEKTRPQTNIVLQIIGIGITIAVIGGTLMSWRISHLEASARGELQELKKQNLREHDEISKRFLKLELNVDEHHGDGHPHVVMEKVNTNAGRIEEFSEWMLNHESAVSAINATQNATTKRNQDDIKDLKDWQRSRQSGSDQSNTEQAERIRALERAVYGRESDE